MLKVNDIIIEGEICTLDCECPKLVSKPKFSLKLNLRTFEFFSDLENNQYANVLLQKVVDYILIKAQHYFFKLSQKIKKEPNVKHRRVWLQSL